MCASCKPREQDPELPGPDPPPVNQTGQEESPASVVPPQSETQPIPAWASQLATGIPLLASSLDKLLSRLDNPKAKSSKRRAPSPSDEESEDYSRAPSPILPEPNLSEGELSGSSDQEGNKPSKHSFEAVDTLISSVLETLHLQEPETTPDSAKALFKRHNKSSPVFPTHSQLDQIIQQEWDKPERRFQVNRRFSKLYPFSTDLIEKWSSPPSVDAPVSRLSKTTALPVPDASSFKDAMDKKMESLLRSAFAASGTSLRPILATAWVSRAIQSWVDSLLQGIISGTPRHELSLQATQIKEANDYICEASLDAAQLASRSSALAVAARRSLWMKLWSADFSSKKSLTSLPFKGNLLFGPDLDKLISQATGGKSTLLPQPKARAPFRRGRFFRGSHSKHTRSSPTRQSTSGKSRFGNKHRAPWQGRKPFTKPTDKSPSA
eukprot:XP_012810936.1 PREDICTED: lamina-associated polypeptide 2, isoforms alpha/zeta-like [Xenopus tropicalis]